MTTKKKNIINMIIEFESGEISNKDFLKLFSYLIKSGVVWQLQGLYGRTASDLIESGLISRTGRISWTQYKKIQSEVSE